MWSRARSREWCRVEPAALIDAFDGRSVTASPLVTFSLSGVTFGMELVVGVFDPAEPALLLLDVAAGRP